MHDATKTAGSLVCSGESLWRQGTWVLKVIISFTNYVALGIFLMSLSLISKKRKKSPFSGNVNVRTRDNVSRKSAWHRVESVKITDVIIIVFNKQIPG